MRRLMMFALALMFAPLYLFAQTGDPMPDLKGAGAQAILALIPVTTLFVVWGFKSLLNKIPAAFVIFAVPVIGMALNYAIAYLVGHPPAGSLMAAVFATLATYARELVSTLSTKGLSGPVTVTKLNF